MFNEIVYLLYTISVIVNAQSTETILDKNLTTCFNDTDCDSSESTNYSVATTSSPTVSKDINTTKNSSVNVTAVSSRNTTPSSIVTSTPKSTINTPRNPEGICGCDLTVSSCDINCCCDIDCKDFNAKDLFTCQNDHPKIYDSRYCYESDYIQGNNSRYLLEKLRDNLFCIVVDNLPPVYSIDYDPIISNRSILYEIVNNNKKSRFKSDQSTKYLTAPFNTDKPYKYGDVIWKMQNSYIKKLELPQTGFTGICTFKKALKYLEDWKHSCMQIVLENTNPQLFIKAFTNFTIIASPVLYNDSNFTSDNQSCPRSICVPVKSHYCLTSWDSCKNYSSLNGNCNNGTCKNIVRSVRFVVTHSGLKGIDEIDVYLKIGNASEKFYQYFEAEYKWLRDNESEVFHLSGNPGYIPGKPIIIGTLITNKTNAADYSYVSVKKEEYFLSLPVGTIDDKCSEEHRYAVNFGEDLKLSCKIELSTRNFSINSCVDLQKRIIQALLKNLLFNITEVDQHSIYIAKLNHLDNNGTYNWVKMIFDRIPQSVVTSQVIDDQLICSGLVTSLRIDVVHRHLSEPGVIDNYKILGVATTFSEDSDIYWEKCETEYCIDILSVDVISYVIFHDVSKPSKYFFAEGPSFDISLPHDFFYPFINNSHSILKDHHFLSVICTCVTFILINISPN